MPEKITISINKTANSKQIKIEVRSDSSVDKIEMDQEDFANALFGLAEVPAERRIKEINKTSKQKESVCSACYNPRKYVMNEGFDSVDDFFKWFNTDFSGKIIHWTSFRY